MTTPAPLKPPTRKDAQRARAVLEHLTPNTRQLRVLTPDGHSLTLPENLTALIQHALERTAHGETLAVLPQSAELSSTETAHLLHVSRQHVVNEAEAGRLPHRKVGTHRRFRLEHVLEYQQVMMQASLEARQVLADEAQRLRLDNRA